MRGVDRQATFFATDDYLLFRETLARAAIDNGCAVHAYVLMTNHVHMLITPEAEKSIPRLLQAIGRSYVQVINRKYERVGPLWQGRYKACLIQDDLYLLHCQRYIELNPVRAGMVPKPSAYPYSSYHSNAYGKKDLIVIPHATYLNLASDSDLRRRIYRRMFSPRVEPTLFDRIREATNACGILGNDRFQGHFQNMLDRGSTSA